MLKVNPWIKTPWPPPPRPTTPSLFHHLVGMNQSTNQSINHDVEVNSEETYTTTQPPRSDWPDVHSTGYVSAMPLN